MAISFGDFKPVLGRESHSGAFLLINSALAVTFFGFAIEIAANAALGLVENWESSVVFFLLCGLCLFAFWQK